MPIKVTEQQRCFALEYASNGGNATKAAIDAGYSKKSAHEIGRQLLEKPHVHEMVMRQLNRLRYKSGAIGLNALSQIAQDNKAPANARVSAARALCEHCGILGAGASLESFEAVEALSDGINPKDIIKLFEPKLIEAQHA
ncbi:MAG: terminase small subunit [Alphaproteobacteria bacterium]|nr:terminase small subunit [Alphaproteobacteria bacterium]